MLTFSITLEPATLTAITKNLGRLAESVSYQPGKLSVDQFDPANETRIVDIITEALPTVRDLPDYGEMARRAAKTKRLAPQQIKRRRQSKAMAIGL